MSDDIAEVYADEPEAALEPGDDYKPQIALSISGVSACEDKADTYCAYGSKLATAGTTTYSDIYGIDIDGADIASYALYIKGENDGKLSGSRDLVSAAAENGEKLAAGEWGYIIFDDPSTANDNLTSTAVKQLTGSDVEVTKGQDDSEAHSVVDVTKGIAFAANFPSDAATGHYKSAVTLSLTASPKKIVDGFGGVFYMQDMTAEICKSVDPGTTGALIDKRDWNTYTVARIQNAVAAGSNKKETANCWMTSNLAFDIEGKSDQMTISLSDVIEDKTTWAAGATVQEGVFTNDTDSSTGNGLVQYSKDGVGSEDYKPEYGYYYSWCAATAGSCTDSIADDSSSGKRSASQSICPKGWKLPTGGSGGEYKALLSSSSWTTVKDGTKYNFYPAGYIISSGAYDIGAYTRYWSSTSYSGTNAYSLYYNGSTVNPANNSGSRYYGYSVRCVVEVEPSMADVTYMQDVTTDICKNTVADYAGTLIDNRGTSPITYSVGKLKDGNCWMTQNLRLPAGTKLTSADSDVSSDYTIKTGTGTSETGEYYWAAADEYYGAYYSWCAATAGCKNASGQTGSSFFSGDAVSSICPKNWKLPPYSGTGSYLDLYNAQKGSWVNANGSGSVGGKAGRLMGGTFFPAAGRYSNTSLGDTAGSSGYYWSRSAFNNTVSHYLAFSSSSGYVNPQDTNNRRYGFSVRCVVVVD